jgi:hypothetical protein
MSFGVVLFHTTSAALRSEKLALEANLKVKLVPTPRQFSSDCGMALRFDWQQHETLESLLAANKVETAGIHELI